jgi:hypothetical protein
MRYDSKKDDSSGLNNIGQEEILPLIRKFMNSETDQISLLTLTGQFPLF